MKYKIVQNPYGSYSIYRRKTFLMWKWWVIVKRPSDLNIFSMTPNIIHDVSWSTVEECEEIIKDLENDKKPKLVKFV